MSTSVTPVIRVELSEQEARALSRITAMTRESLVALGADLSNTAVETAHLKLEHALEHGEGGRDS